jgi:hypothetical protein
MYERMSIVIKIPYIWAIFDDFGTDDGRQRSAVQMFQQSVLHLARRRDVNHGRPTLNVGISETNF